MPSNNASMAATSTPTAPPSRAQTAGLKEASGMLTRAPTPAAARTVVTALSQRATFVQLSSEVCTPCRRTHAVLADLAAQEDGVRHVDLDVAQHLDLVRRFDVMRTPTVLLLDGAGVVVGRRSGATDRRQALAALEACPPPADGCPRGTTAG